MSSLSVSMYACICTYIHLTPSSSVCLCVCLSVSDTSETVKQDQNCTFSVQWRAAYKSQEYRKVDMYGVYLHYVTSRMLVNVACVFNVTCATSCRV